MTLIFKVNRQGQTIYFSCFDISDPKNVRIDTKIKSVPRLQPEITKVIQKGVWPWFSRSCNEDRIFSLSPLDSLTPKTYPYVIFSKNSYGKTKIQGGWYPPPPGRPKVDFYLGRPRVNLRAIACLSKIIYCLKKDASDSANGFETEGGSCSLGGDEWRRVLMEDQRLLGYFEASFMRFRFAAMRDSVINALANCWAELVECRCAKQDILFLVLCY